MTNEERVRRLVDGELDAAQSAAVIAEAERDPVLTRLLEDAATVRSALADLESVEACAPPDDLVERSARRAIAEREKAARETTVASHWLAALWRPRAFRARPATLLLTACAVLVGLGIAAWRARGGSGTDQSQDRSASIVRNEHVDPAGREPGRAGAAHVADPASAEPSAVSRVPVRFVLPARGAHSVTVAGDFTAWRTDVLSLEDGDGDGVFVGTAELAPGTHTYMFVVDGRDWVVDPYAETFQDDGFGNRNAVLRL